MNFQVAIILGDNVANWMFYGDVKIESVAME